MSEFVEEDWKLKAHAVVKLRRENTNMLVSLPCVQYLKYTDKTNCAISFLNYQLRRHEGTGLDDHAHGLIHSICQLIITIMIGVIFRLRQTEISGPKTLFSVWLRWCHLSNMI